MTPNDPKGWHKVRAIASRWITFERSALARAAFAMVAVAAAGAGVAALAFDYFTHGVTVVWRAHGRGDEVVAVTNEHRPRIPSQSRPMMRYLAAWDYERFGVPADLPLIFADVMTRLEVPAGPARRLAVAATGATSVEVGGRPYDGVPLRPGRYDVRVRWTSPMERASFGLVWRRPRRGDVAVDASAMTPMRSGDRPIGDRVLVATTIATFAVMALALLAYAGATLSVRRRARHLGGALIVVLAGATIRAWDYDAVPDYRATADELFATWNGWSLLHDGTSRGWSAWPEAYRGKVTAQYLTYWGIPFTVISPYFEQPPLFHLFAGAAAHLGGASEYLHVRHTDARLVPLALSIVTLMLVIAVGRRLCPTGPAALLGGLLYATLPIAVIQGRLVKEEAAITCIVMATALLLVRYLQDGHRRRDLVLAAVLTGLAGPCKVPAVALIPAFALVVAAERRFRDLAVFVAIAAALSSSLLVFAAVSDWQVFRMAVASQSTRPIHWSSFVRFFHVAIIGGNELGNAWLVFLWLATAAEGLATRVRGAVAVVVLPAIVYLIAIGIGSGTFSFGWYWEPLYPVLSVFGGRFLARLLESPDLPRGVLLFVLPAAYSLGLTVPDDQAKDPGNWPGYRAAITLVTLAVLAVYGLAHAFPSMLTRRVAAGVTWVLLAAHVAVATAFVVRYEETGNTYEQFDEDEYYGP